MRSACLSVPALGRGRRSGGDAVTEHGFEPFADQPLGVAHDRVDQLPAGRDVVDEAGDHATGPHARIHLAVHHDSGIDARHLVDDVFEAQRVAQSLLLVQQPLGRRVVQHPLGVAERSHDQTRVELAGGDDRLFDIVMHRRFLRRDEARAHIHAVGAHGQGGDQAARVGHAAGGDERNGQRFGGKRQQDHIGNIVQELDTGLADLAIAAPVDIPKRFRYTVLFNEPFDGIVRRGHPILQDSVSLDAFIASKHVVVSHRFGATGVIDTVLKSLDVSLDVAVGVSNLASVPPLVAKTDFLAVVPRRLAIIADRELPVRKFELPFAVPSVEAKLIWGRGVDRSPMLTWFRELVIETFGTTEQ